MNKKEFIKELEDAMLEQMDIHEAAPHIKYYKEYIENEIDKGISEKEVLARLHSPRIVAKNIIENSESANRYKSDIYNDSYTSKNESKYYYNDEREKNSQSEGSGKNEKSESQGTDNITFSINGKPIKKFWMKLLGLIVISASILLGIAIIGGIIWFLMHVILPCVIVVGGFYIIVKFLKKWLK